MPSSNSTLHLGNPTLNHLTPVKAPKNFYLSKFSKINFLKLNGMHPASRRSQMGSTNLTSVANFDDDYNLSKIGSWSNKKMDLRRIQPYVKLIIPEKVEPDNFMAKFQATPTENRSNKLMESLGKSLGTYVQRMYKRCSFYVTIKKVEAEKWKPAPREDATLTQLNFGAYLTGGMNYKVSSEISHLIMRNVDKKHIDTLLPIWKPCEFKKLKTEADDPKPVYGHSSVSYNDKIYIFGGAFMYDKKRQFRECTNQMQVIDTQLGIHYRILPKGSNIPARRFHHAVVYEKSMVVIGGFLQTNKYCNGIFTFDFEFQDWGHL